MEFFFQVQTCKKPYIWSIFPDFEDCRMFFCSVDKEATGGLDTLVDHVTMHKEAIGGFDTLVDHVTIDKEAIGRLNTLVCHMTIDKEATGWLDM